MQIDKIYSLRISAIVVMILILSILYSFVNENISFNYRQITEFDLEQVYRTWNQRDLRVQDVEVLYESNLLDSKLTLLQHTVLGKKHIGAIVSPHQGLTKTSLVAILLDGLDQQRPTLRLQSFSEYFKKDHPLYSFIKIIPVFRGRTLHYEGLEFMAEGDFCDAYDGATDDAIAFTNVAESLYQSNNFDNILVQGLSRGGNVALLLAVRDERIDTVIAGSAPIDFYRDDVRKKYGRQYKCQFLDGKTEAGTRERLLASSPLFFDFKKGLQIVSLHYGEDDKIVRKWNAQQIQEHLSEYSISVSAFLYPVQGHQGLSKNAKFIENSNQAISKFLSRNSKVIH